MKKIKAIAVALAIVAAAASEAGEVEACTRVTYQGMDSLIIVGRSLDWKTPIPTNLYVYPRGMRKEGSDLPDAVAWTSKYGAVYAVGYDGGVTEGMNEKGLSVNALFCKGTIYYNDDNSNRSPMSLAMFTAWILDNCATTEEAITLVEKQNFTLRGATFDEGTTSTLHWGITDREGNSALVEFNDGVISCYRVDERCFAMANDPAWPAMQSIIAYWTKKGGTHTLPGTVSSADRCVRANFFVNHVKAVGDADLGAAVCRTVLNNSCVPYGYDVEGEPNVSMTQWCSFSNLRDLRYYFDVATASGFYYIDLNKADLRPGAPVRKIITSEMTCATGDQTKALKRTAPFTPAF